MSVRSVDVTKLLLHDPQTLWGRFDGRIRLKFQNGQTLDTTARATIVSSYAWGLIQEIPVIPVIPEYHLASLGTDQGIRPDSILTLLARVRNAMMTALRPQCRPDHPMSYMRNLDELRSYIHERCMQLHGRAYNDFSTATARYIETLDAEDMDEIFFHPELVAVRSTATHDAKGVDDVNATVTRLLKSDPSLNGNSAAVSVRQGVAKLGQAVQTLGWRGFLTDTNEVILGVPICRGFYEGLNGVDQMLKESQSASLSLEMAKSDLKETEYLSRRLQILAMSMRRIHAGDCGTTRYLNWPEVRPERSAGGTRKIHSDLEILDGKYFLDGERGLKLISRTDTHLLGRKNLQVRSIHECLNRDPAGSCEICFGRAFVSLNPNDNPGHKVTAEVMANTSQRVLSNKHYQGSARVEVIDLPELTRRYMRIDEGGCSLYLIPDNLRGERSAKLVIQEKFASSLTDIELAQDIRMINIRRISKIPQFTLEIVSADGMSHRKTIMSEMLGRTPSFNGNFLEYIRSKRGMIHRSDNTLEIDLKDWDYNLAFMALPMRQYSVAEHAKEMALIIESNSEQRSMRGQTDPITELMTFSDKVNEQLKIRLWLLEIILKSISVVDAEAGRFGIPKPWTPKSLGVSAEVIGRRSASGALLFEKILDHLRDPRTYMTSEEGTMDHPLDTLFTPQDIYEHEVRHGRQV